jgi:diaminopimelate decarboxylase
MDKPERLSWRKPTLAPHKTQVANKFGGVLQRISRSDVDGVGIGGLIERHGSPLFIVSEARLRENVRRLIRPFATRYPKVRFGWSYKTNYLNAVCATLHQEGAWAEVVSDFEYEKARALGVPGSRILFNGPYKSEAVLRRAVEEGSHIHVDHIDELYLLDEVARTHVERQGAPGARFPVTLRLNFDTGFAEPWGRFGFNVETGEAIHAARRVAASHALELRGLHSHIGTFILDPRAYVSQVKTMVAFMEQAKTELGASIDTLDIGGGFASLNSLQGVYQPPEQIVPSIEQYAESICSALMKATRARSARKQSLPTLVLETGRAVVDDAEVLVTSVVGTKNLPDGRRAAVLDAGVNALFTGLWYNHDVKLVRPLEGVAGETVLYGPLCMNIDVMRHSIMLPPLKVGDALVFEPAGAYNNTQWMQFICYRPAVVMIDQNGVAHVVRKAEDLATMNALEAVPAHLADPFPNGIPD